MTPAELEPIWRARWPEALAAWSRYTQLRPPIFCRSSEDEKAASLASSFAMIRLADTSIVISLKQIAGGDLEKFPVEIMAHEVGHHVSYPGNLLDFGRALARVRRALPTREQHAPFLANLYEDLLINDRLQRAVGLDMAGVYRAIAARPSPTPPSALWRLYLRIYEILWSLPRYTISPPAPPATVALAADAMDPERRLEIDAQLGARVIRSYARDWLGGAGRFGALFFAYLDAPQLADFRQRGGDSLDAQEAGQSENHELPDGLAEADPDEADGAIHPSRDEELSGVDADPAGKDGKDGKDEHAKPTPTAPRAARTPVEYGQLARALGSSLSARELAARYYRELARPHLIPFPSKIAPQIADPLPEGTTTWELGMPMEDADWLESIFHSPHVIPGVTTVQRVVGETPGQSPARIPLDLYLGIDCSGSMGNPQEHLSNAILAGTVMALSARRAGARVMVVLSGEPGRTESTPGFIEDEQQILMQLVGYLGTGSTFGIHRLADTFDLRKPTDRPAHILLVTDGDIFGMLGSAQKGNPRTGWDVARTALERARGGGTYVLRMPKSTGAHTDRMAKDGFQVHAIARAEDLVTFARAFSRVKYG